MDKNKLKQNLIILIDGTIVLLSYFATHFVRYDFSPTLFKRKRQIIDVSHLNENNAEYN